MLTFEIKNVGPIKEAKVEIGGLTVITGLNNTGKSFIGRTIFNFIKTINEAEAEFFIEKVWPVSASFAKEVFDSFSLAELKDRNDKLNILGNAYYKFAEDIFKEKIQPFSKPQFEPALDGFHQAIRSIVSGKSLQEPINKILHEWSNDISSLLKTPFFEKCKSRHDLLIELNFSSQFNSCLSSNKASIQVTQNNKLVSSILAESNKTTNFDFYNTIEYSNCTYLDSPLYMSLFGFIRNILLELNLFGGARKSLLNYRKVPNASSDIIDERRDFPYYLQDLLKKATSQEIKPMEPEMNDLYKEIRNTISGEVNFDSDSNDFVLKKNGSPPIKSKNLASGIKSLGLIQSLIKGGSINKNTVLVIDEPENHLHPQWQKEYAELIVKMVEVGIPLIISSHSPYMLEALKIYAGRSEIINNKTKFYYGEMTEQGSQFKDVTKEGFSEIFKQMSLAMQKIAFEF